MPQFLQTFLSSRQLGEKPRGEALPTLDDLVREYIEYVLVQTHHNIARSARILRVSRTTLYNRMRGGRL
jgi:DNA-binding NtrC family response regulator